MNVAVVVVIGWLDEAGFGCVCGDCLARLRLVMAVVVEIGWLA